MNDIYESLTSSAYLFADDTKLYRIIKESNDTIPLQEDLNEMINSGDIRLLKFNKEKCKLLTVNSSMDRNYYIHSNTMSYKLKSVISEQDIGAYSILN